MRSSTMVAAMAAFIGSGAMASAADLSTKDSLKDTPIYAEASAWSGPYIGGHAGGLWSGGRDSSAAKRWCKDGGGDVPTLARAETAPSERYCTDWEDAKKVTFEQEDDDVSFVGGVHVGYNWQRGSGVFGLEGDIDFADEVDYLASLRARLGYAAGDLLIYATAGVAFAGFEDQTIKMSTRSGTYSLKDEGDSRIGVVVGGGLEYKLRPNWSVGVEGLYYAFGDEKSTLTFEERCKEYMVTTEQDNDLWTVRARLTYHFGADEAEVAPLK